MSIVTERTVNCSQCGAPNFKGAAICGRCGATLPGPKQASPVIPAPPVPVLLPLPIMRGITWVSWLLLAINILVWLAMTIAGGSTDSQVLLNFGAKYGPAILRGEYWRLFTSMFLHIGIMHLGFNSYALYALGPEVERFFGRGRYVLIYLLSGVLSSITSYLISSNLAAGASGAIFGLVGALAAFYLHERDALGTLGRRRLNNLVSVVVINLFIGFTVPNIDNAAHIGGLVVGLLVGWVLSPEYKVVPAGPSQPAHVVDINSVARRWWLAPAALALAVGLILLANLREMNSGLGLSNQGEYHLQQGEWEEAVEDFSRALDADPDLWRSLMYRGEAYIQLDDYDAAQADFERVIEAGAGTDLQAVAHSGLGRVHMLRGKVHLALTELDTAVELDPDEPFSLFVRGLIHAEIGHREQAIQDLEMALSLGLEDTEAESIARQTLQALGGSG